MSASALVPATTRRRPGRAAVALGAAGALALVGAGASFAGAPIAPNFGPAIEGYAASDPQDTCSPTEKPGTQSFRKISRDVNAGTGDSGIVRDCGAGGVSEHKEGRAWDWRVSAFTQDANAQDVFRWLFATDRHGNANANFRRLGIMYMIYNKQIISSNRISEGWRPYACSDVTSCHQDHVHFSLSRAGGAKETTYWSAASAGGGTTSVGVARPQADGQFVWKLTDFNDPARVRPDVTWGRANLQDKPLPGDWDGDRDSSPGIARPVDGQWVWKLATDGGGLYQETTFGRSSLGDIPVVGDWNNDGRDTVGVVRPRSDGQFDWIVTDTNSATNQRLLATYGRTATDRPVVGDWDGDGDDNIGVVRDGANDLLTWKLTSTNAAANLYDVSWGRPSTADQPLPGDWDGDGRDTPGITRTVNGELVWKLGTATGSQFDTVTFGRSTTNDRPVAGDWNGS